MNLTPETPTTVEPGQVWVDNDWRSIGAGEFVVVEIVTFEKSRGRYLKDRPYAQVIRRDTGVSTLIRCDRLLRSHGKNGYTYLGRGR